MINLLPSILKKELRRERIFRMLLADGFGIGAALVALLLLLFSILAYGSGVLQTQGLVLSAAQQEFLQLEAEGEVIRGINTEIAALQAVYGNMARPSLLFEQLEQDLPQGVILSNLSYAPQSVQTQTGRGGGSTIVPARVAISGYAPARDTLVELQRRLEENSFFQTVTIPPANWVAPVDVEFSIQLELAPNVL